jgi:hypothetical protein
MRIMFRVLLILEFIIAFSPVIYLWILSLIVFPASVMLVFTGGSGGFIMVSLTILGSLGFWGIIQLLLKILNPETPISKPSHIIAYLILGVFSLVIASITMQATELSNFIMFLMPAFVTLHFAYLARGYFKKAANKPFKQDK